MMEALYILGGLVVVAAAVWFFKKKKEDKAERPAPPPYEPQQPEPKPPGDIFGGGKPVPAPTTPTVIKTEDDDSVVAEIPLEEQKATATEKVFLRDLKDAPLINGAREFHIPAGATVAYAFNTSTNAPRQYRLDFSVESEVFLNRTLDTSVGDESGNEVYNPLRALKISFGTGKRRINKHTGYLASRFEVAPGSRMSWRITNHGNKDGTIRAQFSSIALTNDHYEDA